MSGCASEEEREKERLWAVLRGREDESGSDDGGGDSLEVGVGGDDRGPPRSLFSRLLPLATPANPAYVSRMQLLLHPSTADGHSTSRLSDSVWLNISTQSH